MDKWNRKKCEKY